VSEAGRALAALAILTAGFLVVQFRSTGEAVPLRRPLDAFPAAVGEWSGRHGVVFDSRTLQKLKLTDYVMRDYVDPAGRQLNLYVGYWDNQRRGAGIHSPKHCLPGAGWEPLEASVVTIHLPSPKRAITVNRYLIQKEQSQAVVLYWYQSRGEVFAGEVRARLALVQSALTRNRTDGALVRVISPLYGSVPETTERLAAFVRTIDPILATHLPD
jgi:EpsI family protein